MVEAHRVADALELERHALVQLDNVVQRVVDLAFQTRVALPAEGGSHLDGNPRAYTGRKNTLFVSGILLLE